MRVSLLVAAALCLPRLAAAAGAENAWAASVTDGARAAFAAHPLAAPPPTPPPVDEEALKAAVLARMERNPVAAELAAPVLREPGRVTLVVRGEKEDGSLGGAWATYKRDRRLLVLNRNAINEDLDALGARRPCEPLIAGRALSARQREALAERYLPVFAHELGGHARHYNELAAILLAAAPNVRETEIDALFLEAMTTAAERKRDPAYLRDDTAYASGESKLVDKYWESKEKSDPEVFREFVSQAPAYAALRSARDADPKAQGPVAAYYRDDEKKLVEVDRRIVGSEPPEDEIGMGRRTPLEDAPMRGRR